MNGGAEPQRRSSRKTACLAVVLVVAWLVPSAVITFRSYSRSDSLTIADATLRTDEGLVSLQIPLVRLASTEKATTNLTTYARRRGAPV